MRAAHGSVDRILAAVRDYMQRAFAAQLSRDSVRDSLSISTDCILDRAELSIGDEGTVIEVYASLDKP